MGIPVRIVFISSAEYRGGAERYLELLAMGLDRGRYEPVLVTFGAPGLDDLRSAFRREGCEIVTIAWPSTFSALGWRGLGSAIAGLRPCIVHCNLPGPFDCRYGIPALCARRAGAAGIVSTEHLPMVPTFARARLLRGISAGAIDRVITVSRDNEAHLQRIHRVDPARIRVVYNGIPDPGPPAEPPAGDGTVRILMVGSIERRKGHETILEALARLDGRYRLVAAGAGPDEERVRSLALRAGLGERVDLIGPSDDVPSLLAGSMILAVPSLLEATPYVILEAMAAGRAVVASGIYGIPELVEDEVTGLLIPPGDPDALAEAIRRLGERPDEAARMGRAGRSVFEERFTLARCAAATAAVYDELLETRSGLSRTRRGRAG